MAPTTRKLRGYAFDPSLSNRLDTFQINEIIYKVPWETIDYSKGTLKGEYIEIIDYDPTVETFYETIDFNEQGILAQNGLSPSESNPMFHQQMVYAVVMTTIKNFEYALGRKVLWSARRLEYDPKKKGNKYEDYVDVLRIYPHAMRESNAYYSPQKKALLFGYFHSNPIDQTEQMPNSLVYTCLSHDIIAHETTHAILDGMQKHYNEPSNPDVLAFHEAFSDIVALFQHFSFPEVLMHQIARTKGDLSRQNLLGELAQQFGVAIGNYGSLRDAIGGINNSTGKWEAKAPDPSEYATVMEPHKRGSILVAAVFEAFLSIYKRRVIDLYRIASNGTGVLPQGELHPDLVKRLANEASKTAKHVLNMCIRAVDYCPPVDITFGEYLRAIITADHDVIDSDSYAYRLAFIDAFRKRGIFPVGINSLSIESLMYPAIALKGNNPHLIGIVASFLRNYGDLISYETDRQHIYKITHSMISGYFDAKTKNILEDRNRNSSKVMGLHERIGAKFSGSEEFIKLTGLAFDYNWEEKGIRTSSNGGPSYSVQNLRLVSRVGPNGKKVNQVVFSLVQRCGAIMKDGKYVGAFFPGDDDTISNEHQRDGFQYKAGCTLILDLETRLLKYAITKPMLIEKRSGSFVLNTPSIEKQWHFLQETVMHQTNEFRQYFGSTDINSPIIEPFSLLHQH